jgi:hypothetical protein
MTETPFQKEVVISGIEIRLLAMEEVVHMTTVIASNHHRFCPPRNNRSVHRLAGVIHY